VAALSEYRPEEFVTVPTDFPLTVTETPSRALPFASVTLPATLACCACAIPISRASIQHRIVAFFIIRVLMFGFLYN
jgi:hypothetical protein